MRLCSTTLAAAAVLACAYFLGAQEGRSVPGTAVRALVTTEGRHHNEPDLLKQDDVLIHEGKTRDQVTGLLRMEGAHAGLELLILLDDGAGAALTTQLNEIRQFIGAQPSSTAIGIAYMRNGTAQYASQFTGDHDAASKSIRIPLGQAGINGSPYFSLSDVVKNWRGKGAERREVLMLTDGVDRYGFSNSLDNPYVNQAISDAQKAGIAVFSIYTQGAGHAGHAFWRNNWGQNFLSQVSDQTGGESYYIGFESPVSLKPYLDDLSKRLNGRQYLVSFIAKPENKAGLRAVRIATEVENMDLAAPSRVWVPAGK